jgi:K+-transporting ATPase KdpC subunit
MDQEVITSMIRNQVKPAFVIFLLLTLITGIFYPLLITGIAQLIFPVQANGNFIVHDGKIVGSALIGQPFTSPGYFWGRPSATTPMPYNADLSSGSNLGPSNPALLDAVNKRIQNLHAADPANSLPVPIDLVTSSGSGLDPDISVAAAFYQVHRIAGTRNLSEGDIQSLVDSQIKPRQFWIFGEPRVNVLELNLALDDMSTTHIVPSSTVQPDLNPTGAFGLQISDWIVLILFFGFFIVTVVPMGRFIVKVIKGEPHILSPISVPVEHRILTWSQVNAEDEMDWKTFAIAMMVFSFFGILFLFVIQLAQPVLPLNPAGVG